MIRFLLLITLLVSSSMGLLGQIISVSDTEFSQTLTVPNTANDSFVISNTGIGDLTYTISGQNTSLASPLNILLYNYNPSGDFSTQLTMDNLLSVLGSALPSAIITETDTEDPALLASLLGGKTVFLVPRVRSCDPAVFEGFAPVLDEYANGGGSVVFLGTDQFGGSPVNHIIFSSGLFDGTINGNLNDPHLVNLELVSPNHPIVEDVSTDLVGANTTYYFSVTNEDATQVVGYDTGANVYDLVTTRNVGQGRAVLLGFNYFNTNEDVTKILANTLKFAGVSNENYWLEVSPESGTIGPDQDETINLTFDATLIPAGDYTVELVITHNDSSQDPIIVTCNLSTNGVAAISVPESVTFGNVVQTTSKSITVDVFNPGADTLFVTDAYLSGNFPITVSPTSFWVYPTLTTPIVLTYSPTVVESFAINLTIENNVETQVIPVNGNGTGAPTMNLSETDIVYDINAGDVESTTITLTNDGLGDLEYEIDLTLSAGLLLEAGVSTYGAAGSIQIVDTSTDEIAFEIPFLPGDNIQATITTLDSAGSYELEIVDASGSPYYGGAFVQPLTLTDLITGNELINEPFLGVGQTIPFSGATPNWLSSDPSSGVITFVSGGSNSGDVEIVFDASGLAEGTYSGTLIINPNEPLDPQVINITLNVTGIAEVSVEQSALDFGPVLAGLSNTQTIEISNPGTADLEVNNITFASPNYSVALNNFIVQPFQSVIIDVTFSPDMEGNFDSTMTLETNAGDVSVDLLGEGTGAPAASVTPGFIEFFLISGEMADSSFVLSNLGQGPLLYTSSAGSGNSGFELTLTGGPDGASVFYFFNDDSYYGGGFSDVMELEPNETASVSVEGLDPNLNYTLGFFPNFGSVTEVVCSDLGSGQVVASADNIDGTLSLGSPTLLSWLTVNPDGTELDFPSDTVIPFNVDATGLSSGQYLNTIVVSSNDPVNPTVSLDIVLNVSAFPSAQAGVNSTLQCGESGIQFMDESLNIPTSFFWDFGDGNTSTEQNPFHSYAEGGIYDVMFVGCNTLGCDTLELAAQITVDLACLQVSMQDDVPQLVESCNGFVYDSGGPEGPYFNNIFAEITIAPPGASSVTLSFTEFEFEEPFDGILVFDGPDVSSPLIGEFTGTSLPPDITSTGGSLTIVENSDDNFTLDGFTAIYSCAAPQVAPSASFSAETTSVCSGLLDCADNSSNFPTSWAWDFGDGGTSAAPNPNHQYTEGGTYTVSLEVCNDSGCDTITEDITIEVLYPQVTAPFGTIAVGEAIQFQDNTEGSTLWVWDFGDGNQSVGQNPVHAYSSSGVYQLMVSIANSNIADCSVVYQQDIYVDVPFGIEDGPLFNLDCYPNPANHSLNIDLTLDEYSEATMNLYDMFGRLLFTNSYETNKLNEKVDVADYPSGVYHLVLEINGEKIVRRVAVSR